MRSRWATRNRRKCRKCRVARAGSAHEPPGIPLLTPRQKCTPIALKKTGPSITFSNKNFGAQGTFADPRNLSRGKAFTGRQGGSEKLKTRPKLPLFADFEPGAPRLPNRPAGAGSDGVWAGPSGRSRLEFAALLGPLHPARAPPCRACREVEGGCRSPGKIGGPPLRSVCPGVPPATKASGAPPEF